MHENMHKYPKRFCKICTRTCTTISSTNTFCKICTRTRTTIRSQVQHSRTTLQNLHENMRDYDKYNYIHRKIRTRTCETITWTCNYLAKCAPEHVQLSHVLFQNICMRTYSCLQVLLLHVPSTVPIRKAISDYSNRFTSNSGGWTLQDAWNLKTKS